MYQLFVWGLTALRWPLVGGPGAPEHRRCVSYVVREMVMSSMWSEFGGQEVPHLLHAELFDKVLGHTYPDQLASNVQDGQLVRVIGT